MGEWSSSKPPEKQLLTEEERPTIPVPANPFEQHEKMLNVSSISFGKDANHANQDSIGEMEDMDGNGATLALADGMGGHEEGEVASRIAVDEFMKLQSRFADLEKLRLERKRSAPGMTTELELLRTAMKEAARTIKFERAERRLRNPNVKEHERREMATTAVFTRLSRMPDGRWEGVLASVGDSRAYLLHKDGRLETLTLDAHPLYGFVEKTFGRDVAMKIQSIFDELESSRQYEHLLSLAHHGGQWPEDSVLRPIDLLMLEQKIGSAHVKEYFDGPTDDNASLMVYRSVLMKGVPFDMSGDYLHLHLPPGSKLILSSDADDVLMHHEKQAILSGASAVLIDPKLTHEAKQGTSPADAYARAILARAEFYAYSPRSRGRDDISVIVAEIPER